MGSFSGPDPLISDEIQLLQQKLRYRNELDVYFYQIGSQLINQRKSGGRNTVIEEDFKTLVSYIDQAHQDLVNFIKYYLSEDDSRQILFSVKYKTHIDILLHQIEELKIVQQIQKDNYEGILKRNTKEFSDQKDEVDLKYSKLQKNYQDIEKKISFIQSCPQYMDRVRYSEMEIFYKSQQQKMEISLKERTEVIQHLKLQLSQCQAHISKTKKRVAYDVQIDTLLNQLTLSYSKHEKIESKNQQEQQKLQEKLQEYEHQISILQATLNDREEHINKLNQYNDTLHEDMSKLKVQFNRNWSTLKGNFIDRGVVMRKLQDSLNKISDERDALRAELLNCQREMKQHNLKIGYLNNEILKLTKQRNLTSEGNKVRTSQDHCNQITVKKENQQIEEIIGVDISQSLRQIENILENSRALENQVRNFSGTREEKSFLHLQELLIRNILKLDSVETEGNFLIRKRRKNVIQYIQSLLDKLKEHK